MVSAAGRRIGWLDIPPDVRLRIERIVGGRVVEAVSQAAPWVEKEIDAAVTALRDLATALTPAPGIDVPAAAGGLAKDLRGWD
jgi:hypothetical protein